MAEGRTMTTEQEIAAIAGGPDQPDCSPALAVRLRAVAARVAHQERCWTRWRPGRHPCRAVGLAVERKRAAEARRAAG